MGSSGSSVLQSTGSRRTGPKRCGITMNSGWNIDPPSTRPALQLTNEILAVSQQAD